MLFKDKKILITGHLGMIGRELWEILKSKGALLAGADLKNGVDLKYFDKCLEITEGMDFVFLLHGIKGNPKMTKERPLDFFVPMVMANTNMLEACRINNVKRVLYTSSIAVENFSTDKFPAIAKMLGEQQIEAMRIQHSKGTKYCVVRPANVYGKYDNFDNPDAMVITSLINQAKKGKITLYNGGKTERDFIHAKDVALGMIEAMEVMTDKPINLCSETGVKIGLVSAMIASHFGAKIVHAKTETFNSGNQRRVMMRNWNNPLTFDLETGIKEVCDYVKSKK